jgi:hypothetical protein
MNTSATNTQGIKIPDKRSHLQKVIEVILQAGIGPILDRAEVSSIWVSPKLIEIHKDKPKIINIFFVCPAGEDPTDLKISSNDFILKIKGRNLPWYDQRLDNDWEAGYAFLKAEALKGGKIFQEFQEKVLEDFNEFEPDRKYMLKLKEEILNFFNLFKMYSSLGDSEKAGSTISLSTEKMLEYFYLLNHSPYPGAVSALENFPDRRNPNFESYFFWKCLLGLGRFSSLIDKKNFFENALKELNIIE